MTRLVATALVLGTAYFARPAIVADQGPIQYRILATSKTSTMEKELNEVATEGFRFAAAMGGETAVGSEVVVVMQKHETAQRYRYALLATSKTSTMQKELQAAAAAGFEYVGQTVFKSMFGGREVACILERDTTAAGDRYEYRLVATTKTSTMQKELQEAGDQNFEMVGLTVGQTALGGNELVSIVRRKVQ